MKRNWMLLAAAVPLIGLAVYGVSGESKPGIGRFPGSNLPGERTERLSGSALAGATLSEAMDASEAEVPETQSPEAYIDEMGPQADLIQELAAEPSLKKLAKDPDVQMLLRQDHRDILDWLAKAPSQEMRRAFLASEKLVTALSPCLANPKSCRVNTDGWEPYFSSGGSPLHQILERGLETYKSLYELGDIEPSQLDRSALMRAQQVPHHNISVMATDLLLSAVGTPQEFQTVLQSSEGLKGPARAFFYEIAGPMVAQRGWADSQNQVAQSIFQTLGGQDQWTAQEVISNLDEMGLNQEQFEAIAKRACPAQPHNSGEDVSGRRVTTLQSQARRLGFMTDISSLCFGRVTTPDAGR